MRHDDPGVAQWGVGAVIVAICADKGSPGVTTLATALALVWPGTRVLLEADPSGGDLMFRTHAPGAQFLDPEPSILSLAVDSRSDTECLDVLPYAQPTGLGVPVIVGALRPRGWVPMQNLWSQVATVLQRWPGVVIADMGRFQPGDPGLPLMQSAAAVILVTGASVEGLFHTRARVVELTGELDADPRGELGGELGEAQRGVPLGVVVRAGARDRDAMEQVTRVLSSLGHPIPTFGGFADDPHGVDALLAGVDTPQLRRTALIRSATDLQARMHRTWHVADNPAGPPGPPAAGRSPIRLRGGRQ